MPKALKTWTLHFFKIAIAIGGLWWVITKTPWNDVVTLKVNTTPSPLTVQTLEPVDMAVLPPTPETPADAMHVRMPSRLVKVQDAFNQTLKIHLAREVSPGVSTREFDIPKSQLVVIDPHNAQSDIKRQIGLRNLILTANPYLLLAAWLVLFVPFLITAWRWMKLMQPQGIYLPYSKCVALTFVGQFYSTFLPGITGGDLVKIIYASKVTGSKTKSTVTVLLDRVIGLVALLMIAGISSVIQLLISPDVTIRNVAIASWGILAGIALGTAIYFSRRLRTFLGVDRLTESAKERLAARAAARETGQTIPEDLGLSWFERRRRRLAEIVVQFDSALHAYRGHVGVLGLAFAVSLVVQLISPFSAYLAGQAFGMKAPIGYYFSFIPIGLLVASVPFFPPGGIGVTESIFLHFFANRGPAALRASTSQTFALAQAVRFLPIAWNLLGSFWVVTGTYSRHKAMEQSREDAAVKDPATPSSAGI